jgi:pimeloyl-ACP methyl ester carboxylesterase
MKRKLVVLVVVTLVTVGLLALSGCGTPATPTPEPTPTPLPGMYDVGGYNLRMICEGSGTPAVIIEGSWTEGVYTWQPIQSEVAQFTQACTYDRAGLGLSDSGPTPRSCPVMVDELHTLLEKAGIEGPLVLVGAGVGGFTARLYADRYPDQVVGMVLLNSEHPDLRARLEPFAGYSEWPAFKDLDWEECAAEFEATGSLGDMPLLVLTGQPLPWSEQDDQFFLEMQDELVGLSSNSTHILVEDSGWNINETQPQAVVDAIRSMVEAVRGE